VIKTEIEDEFIKYEYFSWWVNIFRTLVQHKPQITNLKSQIIPKFQKNYPSEANFSIFSRLATCELVAINIDKWNLKGN